MDYGGKSAHLPAMYNSQDIGSTISQFLENQVLSLDANMAADERARLIRLLHGFIPAILRQLDHLRLLLHAMVTDMENIDNVDGAYEYLFREVEHSFNRKLVDKWAKIEDYVSERLRHICHPSQTTFPRRLTDSIRSYYEGSYLGVLAMLFDLFADEVSEPYYKALSVHHDITLLAFRNGLFGGSTIKDIASCEHRRKPLQRFQSSPREPIRKNSSLAWFIPTDEDNPPVEAELHGTPGPEVTEHALKYGPRGPDKLSPDQPLSALISPSSSLSPSTLHPSVPSPPASSTESIRGKIDALLRDEIPSSIERSFSHASIDQIRELSKVIIPYAKGPPIEGRASYGSSSSEMDAVLISELEIDDATGRSLSLTDSKPAEMADEREMSSLSTLFPPSKITKDIAQECSDSSEKIPHEISSESRGRRSLALEKESGSSENVRSYSPEASSKLLENPAPVVRNLDPVARSSPQSQQDKEPSEIPNRLMKPLKSLTIGDDQCQDPLAIRLAALEQTLSGAKDRGMDFTGRLNRVKSNFGEAAENGASINESLTGLEEESSVLMEELSLFHQEGEQFFQKFEGLRRDVLEMQTSINQKNSLKGKLAHNKAQLEIERQKKQQAEFELSEIRRQIRMGELASRLRFMERSLEQCAHQARTMETLVAQVKRQFETASAQVKEISQAETELEVVVREHEKVSREFQDTRTALVTMRNQLEAACRLENPIETTDRSTQYEEDVIGQHLAPHGSGGDPVDPVP
uniref:Uncharacterized protein n=1 Tax=Spongospora subterranea TaxID=70186 RepID=A0A0H5QZN9_9EUKA|eukprot:CRZ07370.1 hypothetical protein [Spongospora subterranea]